jgi:RHS repeat-associated protein
LGSKTFTYNQNNRPIQASEKGNTVAEYFYNGLGQRIGVKRPGKVTGICHYDLRGRLIAETTPGGNTLRQHIYVGDRPLAEEKGGYFGYVHTDHLGTPLKMTNGTGTVIWRADYKPFGEADVDEDPDGNGIKVTMNLRFPGQYFDKETGLHYNYFRDYHPGIGRYVEPDPIGLAGGINLYPYVLNNPINWVDPFGLDTWPYSWKGWGIIGLPAGAIIAGWTPVGWAVIGVGGGLFVWDLIEGLEKGERRGIEQFAKEEIMLKIKTTPIPPKRMQEIGWLPTNEGLREIGFTDKDLRDLGLLEKPCE